MFLSQKDAVLKAINSTPKTLEGNLDRKAVIDCLARMYRNNEFTYSDPAEMTADDALNAYCGSILSNWLRRDPRIGGIAVKKTVTTREKRSHSADGELKRLLTAKTILITESKSTTELDSLITRRTLEIESEKLAKHADMISDAEAILATVSTQQ